MENSKKLRCNDSMVAAKSRMAITPAVATCVRDVALTNAVSGLRPSPSTWVVRSRKVPIRLTLQSGAEPR